MNSLLDTNVVSEYRRAKPNPGVVAYLSGIEIGAAYLSVVTLAEIRFGIERLDPGARRAALDRWLSSELANDFHDRILPVSDLIADMSGKIRARALDAGRPMDIADTLVAATAQVHGLTLVTRNTRDFEVWGGAVFNPWLEA